MNIGTWMSNIKKLYPEDKFIFIILYDKGNEEIEDGFFINCYHKPKFEKWYIVKTVHGLDTPAMSIEV